MVTYRVWFFGAKKLRQLQEGNDPDAYAAAVKESADAVQGAVGARSPTPGAIHRDPSTGTFVVWPFRSCIACLKASFSTRSNVL
jgi:hypothetical protein